MSCIIVIKIFAFFRRLYTFYDANRHPDAYRRVITTVNKIKESEEHFKRLGFVQYVSTRPDDGRVHLNAVNIQDKFKRKDTKSLKSRVLEMKKTKKSPQEIYDELSQEEDALRRPRDQGTNSIRKLSSVNYTHICLIVNIFSAII